MPVPLATVVAAALRDLLVLDAADTPADEDVAAATGRADAVLDELAARRICVVGDRQAIAEGYVAPLAACFAAHLRPMFGGNSDPAALAQAERRLAEVARRDRGTATPMVRAVLDELALLGADPALVDATLVAERLPRVLAELAARRICVVTDLESVPDGYLAPLAACFAAHLRPLFGGTADASALARAERRLAEVARRDRAMATPMVRAVLDELALLRADPSLVDATLVAERLPLVLAELAARGAVYIPDAEALDPDDPGVAPYLPDVCRYLAAALADPPRPEAMTAAELRLRRMATNASLPTLATDYF